MGKRKKYIRCMMCVILCITILLTGCSLGTAEQKENGGTQQNSKVTGEGTDDKTDDTADLTDTADESAIQDNEHIDQILDAFQQAAAESAESAGEDITLSLTNTGNNQRMRACLAKMAEGEETTIVYLGGSITEGYLVNSKQNYPAKVTASLRDMFQNESIKTVNSGLSGTSSTIGMLRFEQDVAAYEPDMVVIEFAVNDAQDSIDKMMYESLVKECLMLDSKPAVVILLTVTKEGYSCEEQMTRIAEDYELPVINVKSALFPQIDAGTLTFADYALDEAHPSGDGHTMISNYFSYYFSTILAADSTDTAKDYTDAKSYGAAYMGLTFYNSENLTPEEIGGFVAGNSNISHFPNGWIWNKTSGSMKFTMTGRNLFLLYKENNGSNMGTMEVYIDGKLEKTVYANSPDGWDNPEVAVLLNDISEGEHEIELKMTDDSTDKIFHILGFGTTGSINSAAPQEEADSLPLTERAVVSVGNTSRLQKVLAKAAAGEPVTIGFIGGSITMGTGASNSNNCYAKKVFDWWEETFPDTEFTYINAGIGATTSQFACARLYDDLLSGKPDFVVVEFSVNDGTDALYRDSYESLLRMILSEQQDIAVMILNMVQYSNGWNVQAMHNEIAENYELPIVSMKDSVYQDILAGEMTSQELSGDTLHPNDLGHSIAADLVTAFIERVMNGDIGSDDTYEIPQGSSNLTFTSALRHNSTNSTPLLQGFTEDTAVQNGITDIFKNGYTAKNVGDSITFEVTGSKIYLQYRKTNQMNAPKAVAIIDQDEENAIELDGNYPDGWGNWLYLDDLGQKAVGSGTHTVEIRITEQGSNDFYLVSVITTGE